MKETIIQPEIHNEKTILAKEVYHGRILNLWVDKVELEDGKSSSREWIEHSGGVCVIALDEDKNILLVDQFRYPYKHMVTEIPAGKREHGEAPIECAKRELLEETGYEAKSYEFLGELYPSPGYVGEIIYTFLATGLTKGKQCLDDGEFLTVKKMHLDKACEMVLSGEIKDSKTQCAILKTVLKQIY